MLYLKNLIIFLFLASNLLINPVNADVTLRNFGKLPNIEGIDHKGKSFSSDDFIKKEVVLLNFFFTSCQGPCPALMLKMNKINESSTCSNLKIISVTVDPETDTPEILNKYRSKMGIENPDWIFLRMSSNNLDDLLDNKLKLGSGESFANHTTRIVVADRKSEIRAYVPGMEKNTVKNVLNSIEKLCIE